VDDILDWVIATLAIFGFVVVLATVCNLVSVAYLGIMRSILIMKKGYDMPLVKGEKAKTKKGFSENVKREMESGKKQSQAVAIAYKESRQAKKKKKK